MTGKKLPRVTVNSYAHKASNAARRGERIIEISSDAGGCLVSLREVDGRLRMEVYRIDDTVDVLLPQSGPGSPAADR